MDFRCMGSRKRYYPNWQVGRHTSAEEVPTLWISASVPGSVQADWAEYHGLPAAGLSDNWKMYLGLEDFFWTYRTSLGALHDKDVLGGEYFLHSEGIDFECDIILGEEVIAHQAGMQIPVDIDISDGVKARSMLSVRISPAPKELGLITSGLSWAQDKRSRARRSTKPAASYGDDFHPGIISTGIWEDTYVERRPHCHLTDIDLMTNVSSNLREGAITVSANLSNCGEAGSRVDFSLRGPTGRAVARDWSELNAERVTIGGLVKSPALWWTHDQGAQSIYCLKVRIVDRTGEVTDEQVRTFGFRSIELVNPSEVWAVPADEEWPKPSSASPTAIVINGRKIFARGANCVLMDIFYGRVTRQECWALVNEAVGMHFNILRIPGGSVAFKSYFYEACDQLGMLVWQDFPLACNDYPDAGEYLKLLDAESRSLIRKLKDHPSVALWCGGNELFNAWSGMTNQSLAIRLLDRNTLELDAERPFISTTPLPGAVHGPYEFRVGDGRGMVEATEVIRDSSATAYPEFGCASPASKKILEEIIPEDDLFPPRPGTAWEGHGGFHAFDQRIETWLNQDLIEHYFGAVGVIDDLVNYGQLLQSVALQGIFEEARRQAPFCSMAMVWALNEPWPTSANLSLFSWPLIEKPAVDSVRQACRPILASAAISRFEWTGGEEFHASLWLLSDSPRLVEAGDVEVRLETRKGAGETLHRWRFSPSAPFENQPGPTIQGIVPIEAGLFGLKLEVQGKPEWSSSYTLLSRQ